MEHTGFFCALTLGFALSIDSFLAGAGLGMSKVRVPLLSALLAGLVGSAAVGVSLVGGKFLLLVLPASLAKGAGFLILFLIGAYKFFESTVKIALRHCGGSHKLDLRCGGFGILLDLYLVPEHADTDRSAVLSGKEAAFLGLVLALDGFCAGFGAGLYAISPWALLITVAAAGSLALFAGAALGQWVSDSPLPDLSPVGGILFMALAIFQLK